MDAAHRRKFLCSGHGSVFIPGFRECVGVVPVKSLMTGGGGGGRNERERGRDAVMRGGRTGEGVRTRVQVVFRRYA